jgi:hypothetical protein
LVKPLAGLLGVAADQAVFLDTDSLKPGDNWESEIFRAIKEASVFVLCWCCESQKSEFVAKEIHAALLDADKKLVPVLFCSAKLPQGMVERQWIDLRDKILHDCKNEHDGDDVSHGKSKSTDLREWMKERQCQATEEPQVAHKISKQWAQGGWGPPPGGFFRWDSYFGRRQEDQGVTSPPDIPESPVLPRPQKKRLLTHVPIAVATASALVVFVVTVIFLWRHPYSKLWDASLHSYFWQVWPRLKLIVTFLSIIIAMVVIREIISRILLPCLRWLFNLFVSLIKRLREIEEEAEAERAEQVDVLTNEIRDYFEQLAIRNKSCS